MSIRILVCDDSSVIRAVLGRCIAHAGLGDAITVQEVESGEAAIEQCRNVSHDLILMDIVMPGISGIEAARIIRELSPDAVVIFISGAAETALVSNALAYGVDYIPKPVDLRHTALIIKRHAEFITQRKRIGALLAEKKFEFEMAARMLNALYTMASQPSPRIGSFVIPLTEVSGDVVLTSRSAGGAEYLLLADCMGHGLPAALAMISVIPVFEAMTKKGYDIAETVEELDRAVRRLLPPDVLISAALARLDANRRECVMALCGMPPAILVDGASAERIASDNPPLGQIELCHTPRVVACSLPYPKALWIMSDGISEMFSHDALDTHLTNRIPAEALASIRETVSAASPHDDISIAVVAFEPSEVAPASGCTDERIPTIVIPQRTGSLTLAEYTVTLLPSDLVHATMVDKILKRCTRAGILPTSCEQVAIVLTELYVNALDHGLLKLPSELKHRDIDNYFEMRRQRLSELCTGSIRISVARVLEDNQALVRIVVEDTGNGYQPDIGPLTDADTYAPSGRGLRLIRSLSRGVHVSDGGQRTVVMIADTAEMGADE